MRKGKVPTTVMCEAEKKTKIFNWDSIRFYQKT